MDSCRMLSHCLALLFILFPFISICQVRFEKDTIYKFSKNILQNLEKAAIPNFAKAAEDFSFIGDYKNALVYDAKTRTPYANFKKSDSVYFKKFHPFNAAEYIIKRAEKEQIIIINEAHHVPYHRIFIASLLKALYIKGFRYYGAETLDFTDSTINERGYPLIKSGYYIVEPQFGNLVKAALKLGFTVFPYEARTVESFTNGKQRELDQAKNIQQILIKNPTAKILIHAGFDHIREDSVGGMWGKAMAGRLKELTGIDPFTINQEVLTERIDPSLENSFYKMVSVEGPSVFVDDLGNVFSGPEGTNYYDVRLCHPRTHYIENRPHWLFGNNRKHVYLDKNDLTVGIPCLLQVYHFKEDPKVAIPVDVVEITEKENLKPLVLPPGKFQVVIKGFTGKSKTIDLIIK